MMTWSSAGEVTRLRGIRHRAALKGAKARDDVDEKKQVVHVLFVCVICVGLGESF